ncbi:MAG: GNAT family N-acetyltransferase [Actinomycetota bacterium]
MTELSRTTPQLAGSVGVRPVVHTDAAAVQVLLEDLGYPMSLDDVHSRLRALDGERSTKVLVAVDGDQVAGLAVVHWFELLEKPGPLARLLALVVGRGYRGTGVGRRLVDAAEALAKRTGCLGIEVTTGVQRDEAQSFYEQLGYGTGESRYYRKPLS